MNPGPSMVVPINNNNNNMEVWSRKGSDWCSRESALLRDIRGAGPLYSGGRNEIWPVTSQSMDCIV